MLIDRVASNKPKKNGAVDMDELIGNTDGFADSGYALLNTFCGQSAKGIRPSVSAQRLSNAISLRFSLPLSLRTDSSKHLL